MLPNIESSYVGLAKEEAFEKAKLSGTPCRLVKEDEAFYIVTQDFRPERLNFYIKRNIVITVTRG